MAQNRTFCDTYFGEEESHKNKIIKAFVSMSEKDFTLKILKPLFEASGYIKIEYHGGRDEKGKDLILWRKDEIGEIELTVIQVKKYQLSAKVSDTNSFAGVVAQLSQAITDPVPYIDGNAYLPMKIYFVTPYEIKTRELSSSLSHYQQLKHKGLKIIDGPNLIKIIKDKNPQLLSNILGITENINIALMKSINNTSLMCALESSLSKNIGDIYCDIDFSIGDVKTQSLLQTSFKGKEFEIKLPYSKWNRLKKINGKIFDYTGHNILEIPTGEIENIYKKKIENINLEKKRIDGIRSKLDIIRDKIDTIVKNVIDSILRVYKKDDTKNLPNSATAFISNLNILSKTFLLDEYENFDIKVYGDEDQKKLQKIKNQIKNLSKLEKKLTNEWRSQKLSNVPYTLEVDKFIKLRNQFIKKAYEVDLHNHSISEAECIIKINSKPIAKTMGRNLNLLKRQMVKQQKNGPDVNTLRKFLNQCNDFIEACKSIHFYDYELISLKEKRESDAIIKYELSSTIHEVFQTGLDVAILGDAGAGKTTSMQAYWLNNAPNNEKKLYLYAPLSSVINYLGKSYDNEPSETPDLVEGIVEYLNGIELKIGKKDFTELIMTQECCLLLDGIDEIIGIAPWIKTSLLSLKKRFPNAQIIISSRYSEKFIEFIPFLHISLKQFERDQVYFFIERWFQKSNRKQAAQLKKHLKKAPELLEIVRNPLSATILCVLAEHKVRLPESEIMLHKRRLELLTGLFDYHKRVQRIKSYRHVLVEVAQVIGYSLHSMQKKSSSKQLITKIVIANLQSRYPKNELITAIEELIFPCQILIIMDEKGELGFGHLRFQEYLVASEINQTREVNVVKIIHLPWWQDALVLYSQIARSINWIIEKTAISGSLRKAKETIFKMIDVRPEDEREELRSKLQRHIVIDDSEVFITSDQEHRYLLPTEEEMRDLNGYDSYYNY